MGKTLTTILAFLVIVFAGLSFYFYGRYSMLQKNPQALQEQEVQGLVSEVGKLIVLPEGETPVVAEVADVEALKGQEFFAKSAVGDKVLIYTTALKAILYRPSTGKIIEVAPVVLGPSEQTPAATVPAEEAATTEEI